jgi:hypothetical protein
MAYSAPRPSPVALGLDVAAAYQEATGRGTAAEPFTPSAGVGTAIDPFPVPSNTWNSAKKKLPESSFLLRSCTHLFFITARNLALYALHVEVYARQKFVVGHRVFGQNFFAVCARNRALPDAEGACL